MSFKVVGYSEAGTITGIEVVETVEELEAAHDRIVAIEDTYYAKTVDA